MISRRFVLELRDVSLAEARERAQPWRRKHHQAGLWVRIEERRGSLRLRARLATGIVRTYGGSYVPNGTLRARLEPLGPGAGVRVVGRLRWGFTVYLVAIMLATSALIVAMAVGYDNAIIGVVALAPVAVTAVFTTILVSMRRTDPPLLRERLELVLTGRLAERQRADDVLTWQRLLPGRPLPHGLRNATGDE